MDGPDGRCGTFARRQKSPYYQPCSLGASQCAETRVSDVAEVARLPGHWAGAASPGGGHWAGPASPGGPLGGGCKPRGATESSTAPETPRVLANSATRYAGVGAVYVVQNHRYHRGELGGVWAEAVGSRISDATHLLLDISAPSCYVSAVSVTSAASSVKGRRWSGWHASRPGGSIWL